MWMVELYLRIWWKAVEAFAHRHHLACHRAHRGVHLCYFYFVATHGPYYITAMALLVLGIVFWFLRMEE